MQCESGEHSIIEKDIPDNQAKNTAGYRNLRFQTHFDWTGRNHPLCDRDEFMLRHFSQYESEVTCNDCLKYLDRSRRREDGTSEWEHEREDYKAEHPTARKL